MNHSDAYPQLSEPVGDARDAPQRTRRVSVLGLLLALVSAAGMAACIALLYQGTAVIMESAGGFVATGGPYQIVHPAPDWVWLVPLSIIGLIFFGGISLFASARGWGVSLALFAWTGLFVSLGWNFLRLGFDPPRGMQGAWAWILCGVIFWIMGLWPLLLLFGGFRAGFQNLVDRQSSADARRVWRVPRRSDTTAVYLVTQVLGAAVGIAVGVTLFATITA